MLLAIPVGLVAQTYYEQGYSNYINGGSDSLTVKLLSLAIQNNENVSNSYAYRGAAKIYLNDFKGAYSDLEKARQWDSKNYKAFYFEGRLHYLEGNVYFANTCIDLALEINPKDGESYDFKSILLLSLGDTLSALRCADSAVFFSPNNDKIYSNRGYIKILLKDYLGAIEDLQYSKSLGNKVSAGSNLAMAYFNTRNYARAVEESSQVLQNDNRILGARYYRAKSYYELGEKESACSDFSYLFNMKFIQQDEYEKYCD